MDLAVADLGDYACEGEGEEDEKEVGFCSGVHFGLIVLTPGFGVLLRGSCGEEAVSVLLIFKRVDEVFMWVST